MALPSEHLAGLRASIESHEQRLAELRDNIRLAEEEAAVHEALLALARDERLIEAVAQVHDDPDSRFARDPLGHCREESIPLPDGVSLNPVDRKTPNRITANIRRGDWDVEIAWDREHGFAARPLTQEIRQQGGLVRPGAR
jgi:hypothetical protein